MTPANKTFSTWLVGALVAPTAVLGLSRLAGLSVGPDAGDGSVVAEMTVAPDSEAPSVDPSSPIPTEEGTPITKPADLTPCDLGDGRTGQHYDGLCLLNPPQGYQPSVPRMVEPSTTAG